MTTDCWALVWSVALQREPPPIPTFNHLDVNDRSKEAIDTWVEAPWFHRDAIAVGSLCEHYVDGDSWLPCAASLGALEKVSWWQHLCFMDGDSSLNREGMLVRTPLAFAVSTLSGMRFWKSFVEILQAFGMHAF